MEEMLELLKEAIVLDKLQKELKRRIAALGLLYKEEQLTNEQYLKALLVAKKDTEEGMARLDALKKNIKSF